MLQPRRRSNRPGIAQAKRPITHLNSEEPPELVDRCAPKEQAGDATYGQAGFDHAASVNRLLARAGALEGDFYGGFFTNSDSSGDIHKITVGLAAAALRNGVKFQHGRAVSSVRTNGQRVQIAMGDGNSAESAEFDGVVICAGSASRGLAAALGDRVNVYPVKGYSITVNLDDLASQAAAPTVSLLDDATKLVTSRLGLDRFRVAGTAEFNGFNRDICYGTGI